MKFIKVLKADENLNKKYRIEVNEDEYGLDDGWDYLPDLKKSGIKLFGISGDDTLKDFELYNGDIKELQEQGWDIIPIYAHSRNRNFTVYTIGNRYDNINDADYIAAVKGKFTLEQEKALENFIKESIELQDNHYYKFYIYDENNEIVYSRRGFVISHYGSERKLAEEMKEEIPDYYKIELGDIIGAIRRAEV